MRSQSMPHVLIKLYTGRSEAVKQRLAEEISRTVISVLGLPEESTSVAVQDVAPSRWKADVYQPDIVGKADLLYKLPGYEP